MSEIITLQNKQIPMIDLGARDFDLILNYPGRVPDIGQHGGLAHRPGMQILAKQQILGHPYGSKNAVSAQIYNPPGQSVINAAEKLLRSFGHNHMTSQESENPDAGQFRGCLNFRYQGVWYQVSVSGLMPDEDVIVSARQQSLLTGASLVEVLQHYDVEKNQLPKSFFDPKSYMYAILQEFKSERKPLSLG